VVISSAFLVSPRRAEALTQYLTLFSSHYGTSGTRLDTCGVCHVNFGNNSAGRNSFGTAFERVPLHVADPVQAFVSLEGGDPDADGTLSGEEIAMLFLPGWSCANVDSAERAPEGVDLYVDPANPGCVSLPEGNCFDSIDDDGDGLLDCADPDCEGAFGDGCDTGLEGVCATGTLLCREGNEACSPDQLPVSEGPFGDATCSDEVDGDCDGLTDGDDTSCQMALETACFDGADDDQDGLVDCEDPDCGGAVLGSCDTGEAGLCAAGTITCSNDVSVCLADQEAEIEAPTDGPFCSDGLDNDCDARVDAEDEDCAVAQEADVYVLKLRAPKTLKLRTGGGAASRRIVVTADGDVAPQEVTVELFVEPIQAAIVAVDPALVTGMVEPGGGASRMPFDADITCLESGTWRLDWTATIHAPENQQAPDDVAHASTRLTCR
jgi:hypothetical protein